MATDWIKVEKTTPDKREILAIALRLGISAPEAFTLCFRFWAWADTNFADGVIKDITPAALDSVLAYKQGFAQALVAVGWLQERGGSSVIPNFHRHLGQSAKRRATDAVRKQMGRLSAQNADINSPSSNSPSPSPSPSGEKEGVVGETIGGPQNHLAQLWRFHLRRPPNSQDDAAGVAAMMSGLHDLGVSWEELGRQVIPPLRDGTETIWEFRNRVKPKKTDDLHAGGREFLERARRGHR